MKTKIYTLATAALFCMTALAQDVTTVNAASGEISDNLDLRAVASIFGDSENLADFERRLNDPELQISNLDLNDDNQVDYLRVVESVEGYTHLIVIQAVLGRDLYQDVATIEVERDARNNVQVQVVGDVYMYGPNYIYEPVYVAAPVIYTTFWVGHYRPYCSTWYWGYYPTYFSYWHPYPVFRYRRNVHVHINTYNHYNYVNVRRSTRAAALYATRRSDAYARQYPNRAFTQRHANVANRYELDQRRTARNAGLRNELASNSRRNDMGIRSGSTKSQPRNGGRTSNAATPGNSIRNSGRTTAGPASVRGNNNSTIRSNATGQRTTVRSNAGTKTNTAVRNTRNTGARNISESRSSSMRTNAPARQISSTRQSQAPRVQNQARPQNNATRTASGNSAGRNAAPQQRQGNAQGRQNNPNRR